MSHEDDQDMEREKVSRRDFIQNSVVAMTGGLLYTGLSKTASTDVTLVQEDQGRRKILLADEVQANGSYGIKLTSLSRDQTANLDLRTGGSSAKHIRLRITKDGYVGIGTTKPGSRVIDQQRPILDVVGYTSLNGLRVGLDGFNDILSDNPGGMTMTCVSDKPTAKMDFKTGGNRVDNIRLRITKDGNVGIGTTEPSEKLHVQSGNVKLVDGTVIIKNWWADWIFLRQGREGDGGQSGFHIHNPKANPDQPDNIDNRFEIGYRTSGGEDRWGQFVIHGPSGRIGIGTTEPSEKLHVRGTIKIDDGTNYGLVGNDTPPGGKTSFAVRSYGLKEFEPLKLQQQKGPHSYDRLTITEKGNVAIGQTWADEDAALQVKGTIKAYDVALVNADCAEEFTIEDVETVEPGTVMVIDHGTALRQCREAYDTKVVGVVSGAGDYKPALLLDRQTNQTNRLPVALMGKVYCKVDAHYAPVEVGDLLTTSTTTGHAMKATDSGKAFGAIIGKALGSLESGMGLIPILVTLQ